MTDGSKTGHLTGEGAILVAEHVSRHYSVDRKVLKAVDRVDLTVAAGRTVGIVGESGCGKSTLSKLLLRMENPSDGRVLFKGTDTRKVNRKQAADFHQSVGAVFQDPYSSLNPRHRVEEIVSEPVFVNRGRRAVDRDDIIDLLGKVGLPAYASRQYPHEFSGGQRQRIAIARALSIRPEVVVLDEPVSALDISIRAQILNLLKDLQDDFGVAYVFIAHDLSAVRYMSDEVHVMYLGSVVERAPAESLYQGPLHPYTRALLDASLPPDPSAKSERTSIRGELPDPIDPPSGCRFRTRCPIAVEECAVLEPQLRELRPDHWVACHLAEAAPIGPARG